MEGLIVALLIIMGITLLVRHYDQTTDRKATVEPSSKPKSVAGVIGKVKVDGLYKYVCVDERGIVWIGSSIWWYMLDGKDCGDNWEYFNNKYHTAQYKESAGHTYPILKMADLLDDDKRKALLERLNEPK